MHVVQAYAAAVPSDAVEVPWLFRLVLRAVQLRSTRAERASEEAHSDMELKGLSLEFQDPSERCARIVSIERLACSTRRTSWH